MATLTTASPTWGAGYGGRDWAPPGRTRKPRQKPPFPHQGGASQDPHLLGTHVELGTVGARPPLPREAAPLTAFPGGSPKLPGEAARQGPAWLRQRSNQALWLKALDLPLLPSTTPCGIRLDASSDRRLTTSKQLLSLQELCVSGLFLRWSPNHFRESPSGVSHSSPPSSRFRGQLCARCCASTLVNPTRHVPLAHGRASSLVPMPPPLTPGLLTVVPKHASLSPTSGSTCCSLGPHSGDVHMGPASPTDVERLPQVRASLLKCVFTDHPSEGCGVSKWKAQGVLHHEENQPALPVPVAPEGQGRMDSGQRPTRL